MEKANLKDIPEKQLENKINVIKLLIVCSIPVIIGLFYYALRDYFNGGEIDWSNMILAICTIGSPVIAYLELKKVQEELSVRNEKK